jgi:hypothetical protein
VKISKVNLRIHTSSCGLYVQPFSWSIPVCYSLLWELLQNHSFNAYARNEYENLLEDSSIDLAMPLFIRKSRVWNTAGSWDTSRWPHKGRFLGSDCHTSYLHAPVIITMICYMGTEKPQNIKTSGFKILRYYHCAKELGTHLPLHLLLYLG